MGNEFAPVESLWSHFESIMGRREDEGSEGEGGAKRRESRGESRAGAEGEDAEREGREDEVGEGEEER